MNAKLALALFAVLALASSASAAFLIQIDTDGANNGAITFNSHFTFGGDTTTAASSAPSSAFGLATANSIFGGDGVASPDTYVYRYDPTVDVDNLVTTGVALGVDLVGNSVNGTGVAGGSAGDYRVYAAWPPTSNVSGGMTSYTVTSGPNSFTVDVDQNTANDPDGDDANDVWLYLGDISYNGSSGIIVTQESGSNTFVSMRAAGVLFEPVPEPAFGVLVACSLIPLVTARRRSAICCE